MNTWASSSSRTATRPWPLLQEESSLNEIVQLVGKDSLSPSDQLTLETARIIREDFLQQNAFADIDTYSDARPSAPDDLTIILDYDKLCRAAIAKGASLNDLLQHPKPV